MPEIIAMRPRRLVLPAVLTMIALALLVSLGNWQMRRHDWKEGLIARVSDNLERELVPLPAANEWRSPDFLESYEYRPVRLTGSYVPDETAYVYTVISDTAGPLDGPGYWVMTPFAVETGGTVYVNRGFVPFGRLDDVPPAEAGARTLTGPLRASESGNWLTPDPDLAARVWHVRDLAAMGQAEGLARRGHEPLAPFFVDLDATFTPPGGVPQAGETRSRFPNSHLQYAVTWYGLALALIAVFAAFAWRELSPRSA